MRKFVLTLYALVFALSAFAQERIVSGKVTSAEDGTTLPGVNIIVKGTTTGTTTDTNGAFSLTVPSGESVLVFSFIGLVTQEVPVGGRTTVDVSMTMDVTQLTEVVVVGYGEVDKRKLTSSITSIDGSAIANRPVASFDQALAGRAAGVQVTVPSGMLGTAPRIRIRGTSSITSDSDPLIVIDGVPAFSGNSSGVTDNNALSDINPNDIASFEVLKDGAATAIYGSRAAGGVILITTKSGKSGKVNVDYDGYAGVNTTASRFNLLNANEFVMISNEKFAAKGTAPRAFPGTNNENTDWQDVVFRTGKLQSHNVSVKGGSDKFNFFGSINYAQNNGAIVRNSQDRTTMRANLDYKGVKWLDLGMKVSLAQTTTNGLNTSSNALSGNVTGATKLFPNVAVYDTANPTGYNINPEYTAIGRGNNLQDITSSYTNIKYVLDKNVFRTQNFRTFASGYAQANIIDGLNIRTQYGIDRLDNDDYQSLNPVHGDGKSYPGYLYRAKYLTTRWNWQTYLTYNKTFAENHTVGVTLGNESQKTTYDYFYASGQGYQDPSFLQHELISGTYEVQSSGGDLYGIGFNSYYGRLNYDYKGKYLVSVSGRQDAISSLAKNKRQGTFLGASAGWDVAKESFFADAVPMTMVSLFKLRGSYAEVGNVNIGAFPYIGSYAPALYGEQTALRFNQVGNSALAWETSKKFDAGVDLTVLNDRIDVNFDWYKNNIDGLILAAPTPYSAGLPNNSINKNVGAMVNQGVELSITSENLKRGSLSWSTTLTVTTNKNKVTALNNNNDINYTYTINRVGQSIGSLYGYQYLGVNKANGNPLYLRGDGVTVIQGNPDNNTYYAYNPAEPGDLSTAVSNLSATKDRVILGQTTPKWFGGISNNLKYKGFDFELFLTYSGGNKIYNATRQDQMSQDFLNNNKEILNRWTPQNTNTNVPRLSSGSSSILNLAGSTNSRFVEPGDFLRVQNIVLGYNFNPKYLSNLNISHLRLYVQVQNAHVFSKYKGLDPELNSSNITNSAFGIDNNTNPMLRTFTAGLSVGL
jgi:TonB-linked SusC/RagA family outer membrane protein